MEANVELSGRPVYLETAPTDGIKKKLLKLLEGTNVTNCVLKIKRGVSPDKRGRLTIKSATNKSVGMVIQAETVPTVAGETPITRRYLCELSAAGIDGPILREELITVAKAKIQGGDTSYLVVEPPKNPRGPQKAKRVTKDNVAAGGTLGQVLGNVQNNPAKLQAVMVSIMAVMEAGKGSAPTPVITIRLAKDFKIQGPKTAFGSLYATLRKIGCIRTIGEKKVGSKARLLYEATPKGRAIATGKLVSESSRLPDKDTFMAQSPLQQQIANLEGQVQEHGSLLAEVTELRSQLVAKEARLLDLSKAYEKLSKIKALVTPIQGELT